MKITLVSSCGLVLEQDGQTLLIDALNKQYRCYYGLPPETFVRMLSGEPPYDAVCGILFTHAHPDHYSASRTKQLRAACGAAVVLPQPDTPERLNVQLGPFAVECSRFPHIPVPGLEEIAHAVYWISAAGKSVYVTADAQIDTTRHRAILRGRRADAAFWNGQYLSHPETRELLLEAAEKNFIYHIPVDEKDACGIRRKCERNMARFGADLCWSNTRRFWRYEAKKRRPVPPRLLQTCLWRPHLLCLAGKDGEKGAGVRFSAYCGCNSGRFLIYSCYERTNSPYGRYGTRRLLRYPKLASSYV